MSFVLNETPGQVISAATKARVHAAAEALGYAPHAIARALREGSSRIVLLDVGDIRPGNALRSYIDGMRGELATAGYTLLVRISDGPPDDELVGLIRPRAVVRPADANALGDPAVDGGWTDGLAAHTLVQIGHLAERGHTATAFAIPTDADGIVTTRLTLAGEASRRLGLIPPATVRLPSDRAGGAAAIRALRVGHPEVSAIAAVDDDVALQVLAALADLEVASPTDVAVIGFDDAGRGEFSIPALTSVRIDAAAYGRRAARATLGLPTDDPSPAQASIVQRATT